jgi:hypothetical protein
MNEEDLRAEILKRFHNQGGLVDYEAFVKEVATDLITDEMLEAERAKISGESIAEEWIEEAERLGYIKRSGNGWVAGEG